MGGRDVCPACASQQCKKNGHIHTGKQNPRCKVCGRQCVVHAAHRGIAQDQRAQCRTLTDGENFPPWSLPRSGRQYPMADGFYGRVLCRSAYPLAGPAPGSAVRGHCTRFGGGSRRVMPLRGEEGQQAMGLDCDGQANAPHHCVSCGGSQSREGQTGVGQHSGGLPRAGHLLHGSI